MMAFAGCWLWPFTLFGVAFGAEQRIFWVDDLISQTKVESKLWMMTGEDESFGNRKIRYDDEAYCMEAIGTVNPTICKPSYLINGWNTTDGTTLASRTQLSVAYDPAGEGDGEHVVGPVVDKTNNKVYYITQTCADSSGSSHRRRLGRRLTVWKVKFLLDNQIVPDGTTADPLECANESYVFAVNSYAVDTAKFSLIYVATRANFPAPAKWTAFSWKLAFDESKQRLYWWYYAGSCAVARNCDAPLYYIDIGSLTDDGDMPSPVLAATVTDGYGHAYWDTTIDDSGMIYMVDWYKIRKYDPSSNAVSTLHTEDYLNTGWQFYGVSHWTGTNNLIITKSNIVTSKLWLFDVTDSTWIELYSAVHYEFSNLGQTMYNTAVDASHNLLYVATSGGNSAGRSIIELPLTISGETRPYKACLQGAYSMDCPLYGKGERLVVGHRSAASSVAGSGKASNFAASTADRFPAWGTSQIAVLPATSPTTYPAKNPCLGKAAATIDTLSARLKATRRTMCGSSPTSTGFDTRHILFAVDAGDTHPNYLLRDYTALEGLRTSSDGSFGYSYVGQLRSYANFMDVATGGGNDGVIPGLHSDWAYGNTVKFAVDYKHGYVYWISCERAALPRSCSEYALKRVSISALEAAAKIPDPIDCSTTSCPHSGATQVLDDRQAAIKAATEVLYTQATQLFPGPDDTVTHQVKMAIDQEAEIIYWLAPQSATGYISLMYLDVQGWDSSKPKFEPCDVGEVAGHYAYGSWSSLQVACDGSIWSHEVDVIKTLDFTNDTVVTECKSQAAQWADLDADSRPGWKGCWTRAMTPGCLISATGSCVLKAMAYDPKRDEIYYAFRSSTVKESINRFKRTEGSQGVDADTAVYSGVFYEFPPRADKGAAFIAGLAIDSLNEFIYVANYYANSAQQSLVMLPLPEHSQYPGSNQEVHAKYWPMDLVEASDAPIACLYGHESIPHSGGYGNRQCEYTGERLPWAFRSTGMDVILPNPEGIKRFYIVETSNNLAVLPPKPAVLGRTNPFDWTQFYKMLPHASISLSKVNGWSYLSLPVTATDLGMQPSYGLCAELCSTFWRNGQKRCIGFDWRMSTYDCQDLKDNTMIPDFTKTCAYSNSGLSCIFALVDLTSADDNFKAWPNPCFTMPEADTDGNAWIIGKSGYAPTAGWPSYVREGYSISGERALLFLLKDELLEGTTEGQALRDSWRQAVPNARWYGSTDATGDYTLGNFAKNGKAIYPGDLKPVIFDSYVDTTNPRAMPTEAASCFANDNVIVLTTSGDDIGIMATSPDNGQIVDLSTTAATVTMSRPWYLMFSRAELWRLKTPPDTYEMVRVLLMEATDVGIGVDQLRIPLGESLDPDTVYSIVIPAGSVVDRTNYNSWAGMQVGMWRFIQATTMTTMTTMTTSASVPQVDCEADPENIDCCPLHENPFSGNIVPCLLEGFDSTSQPCSAACQKRYQSLGYECYKDYKTHFMWNIMQQNCDPDNIVQFNPPETSYRPDYEGGTTASSTSSTGEASDSQQGSTTTSTSVPQANFLGSFEVTVEDPEAFIQSAEVKTAMEDALENLLGIQVIASFEVVSGRRLQQGAVRVHYHSAQSLSQESLTQSQEIMSESGFSAMLKDEATRRMEEVFFLPANVQIQDVQRLSVAQTAPVESTSGGEIGIIIAIGVGLVLCLLVGGVSLYCCFIRSQGDKRVHPQGKAAANPQITITNPDASAQAAEARAVETQPEMKVEITPEVDPKNPVHANPIKPLNPASPSNPIAGGKSPQKRSLPVDPPEYWSLDDSLVQGWATIAVDAETLEKLKRLFVVTMPEQLGKGRDAQKYSRSYKDLEVVCAWRVEHLSHWRKYAAERDDVRMNMEQLERQKIKPAEWKSKLEDASKDMPGELFLEVGERYLLHGTHPSRVLDMLHQGFSDKLASLKGMFGAGNYFAEDPEKIDQYTQPDAGYETPGLEELHSRLYRAGGNAHPDEDVFYCFVCRAICGACLITEGLDKTRLIDANTGNKVFLTDDRRELCKIPGAKPSLSYHTLLAELAKKPTPTAVIRFREIVLFEGNRVYPEYLIAYRRI